MKESDVAKAIELLKIDKRVVAVQHATSFVCHRKAKDGKTVQEVDMTILDAGENTPGCRYMTTAKTRDGKRVLAGEGPSVAVAVATMKWHTLDE